MLNLRKKGHISVDDNLKTKADNIWAIGDVAGSEQFTYISLDDYRIINSQINGDKSYNLTKRKNVPYSVFISPTYSRVGLSEKEAKDKGLDYKIFKMPAASIPKAQVLQKPQGLLKILVNKKDNKILGAMLLCEESHEVIIIVKAAMDLDAEYSFLRDFIYTHPTMSESLNDLLSE